MQYLLSRCQHPSTILSPQDHPRRVSYEAFLKKRETGFVSDSFHQNHPTPDHSKFKFSTVGKLHVPEGAEGYCSRFISPEAWSSAFSRAGDFTIKIAGVRVENRSIWCNFAILSSWIILQDGTITRGESNQRLSSYVIFVERKDSEIENLAETLSLILPGHKLVDRVPESASVLETHTGMHLKERGYGVLRFLTYLLGITAVGHNRLVPLPQKLALHPLVRTFLTLPINFPGSMHHFSSTSSCSARIEHQRPIIPLHWHLGGTSISDTPETSSIRSPSLPPVSKKSSGMDTPPLSFCIHFCHPGRWGSQNMEPGAFTVEICAIAIQDGHAKYQIAILSSAEEPTFVQRRYTDFFYLAQTLDTLLPKENIPSKLPAKTLFRYLSPKFLEARSAKLQRFLQDLLSYQFVGMLGQRMEICAAPQVREFLQLPQVHWNLIPSNVSPRLTTQRPPSSLRGSILRKQRNDSY